MWKERSGLARVLLVDDDPLVRRVVRVVLEAEGHEVREAVDGPAALDEVESARPDAIVLDLVIPEMDGIDVCRRIKDQHPEARVLVLTGVPFEDSDGAARDAGADDVMAKPFSALELLERLSKLLGA